ncbi:phosphotransacetylase [Streptomyces cavernicola]|uniref:Phosphotransacetylase n=1 Tax=Streptomyces cavernicola TaxID=3043613 RepID=A0ABT6SCH4_9ACTN|nr:phosphotransacetylase [Streptomyces sp. B-S-A6]MDI3405660.1 phosphotransacetylase [Streptomyces sp. B-S-A6]
MLVDPLAPAQPPAGEAGPAVHRLVESWAARLRRYDRRPRVALADGTDARALWAAARLAAQGAVTPVVVGDPARVRALAADIGLQLPDDPDLFDILDPARMAADPRYADTLGAALDARGRLSAGERRELSADPLFLAATALRLGDVRACVAGSTRPTADVLRAGLYVVGLAPGIRTLSSSFLMVRPDGRTLGYGDCAVVVDPDPAQLADIAQATGATYRALAGEDPRVAFLSFSTSGSASHPRVERVREAIRLARAAAPELTVDGELQYDAAAVPAIGHSKAPASPVAGSANTFVFPSLEAGNIGYKIAQWTGGAAAIGPLLQGLAAPLHDLSRGCSGSDIAAIALVGGLQAMERAAPTAPLAPSAAATPTTASPTPAPAPAPAPAAPAESAR